MKKNVFIFFILFSISFSTPIYNFRFRKASLIKVELSRKRSGLRYLSGIVRNNTNEEISKVEFTVMFKDENCRYVTVGRVNFSNLKPKESLVFSNRLINVKNINGRDFKIKLTKIVMNNKSRLNLSRYTTNEITELLAFIEEMKRQGISYNDLKEELLKKED